MGPFNCGITPTAREKKRIAKSEVGDEMKNKGFVLFVPKILHSNLVFSEEHFADILRIP